LPSSALFPEIVFFTAKQDYLSFIRSLRFLGGDSKEGRYCVGSVVDIVE
jgi:hypothetical protein